MLLSSEEYSWEQYFIVQARKANQGCAMETVPIVHRILGIAMVDGIMGMTMLVAVNLVVIAAVEG